MPPRGGTPAAATARRTAARADFRVAVSTSSAARSGRSAPAASPALAAARRPRPRIPLPSLPSCSSIPIPTNRLPLGLPIRPLRSPSMVPPGRRSVTHLVLTLARSPGSAVFAAGPGVGQVRRPPSCRAGCDQGRTQHRQGDSAKQGEQPGGEPGAALDGRGRHRGRRILPPAPVGGWSRPAASPPGGSRGGHDAGPAAAPSTDRAGRRRPAR